MGEARGKNRSHFGTRESVRTSTETCAAAFAAAEEGVAAARTFLVAATIFVWVQSAVWAGDGGDSGGIIKPVAAVAVGGTLGHDAPIEPFIHPSMALEVRVKLEVGLELAAERVGEIEACGDLFTQLGVDGIELLSTSLYLQVDSHRREVQFCGRDGAASSWGGKTLAYTKVGAPATWICRHLARAPAEVAAVAVIHEALHYGGLTEWPSDRLAMTSEQITQMVKKACKF